MSSAMTCRMLGIINIVCRPSQCLTRYLQNSLSFSTSPNLLNKYDQDRSYLDDVASIVSGPVVKDNKLLVVSQPADDILVQKLQSFGVEKLCCVVPSENQVEESSQRSHNSVKWFKHNLLSPPSENKTNEENTILEAFTGVKGVTFLSTLVVPTAPTAFIRRAIVQYLETAYQDGFYGLHNIDWYCLIPHHSMKMFSSNWAVVRYFLTFHDVKTCHTMTFDEAQSMFMPLNFDKRLPCMRDYDRESIHIRRAKFESSDMYVDLVHIVPKFDIIEQTTLEDRQMYQLYIAQQNWKDRLIPFIEKWVPGAGKHLILQGFSMADEIVKLSPYTHFEIYKIIRSLPEYNGSALCTFLEEKVMPKSLSKKLF